LRRSLAEVLPNSVVTRVGKARLGVNVVHQMSSHHGNLLRSFFEDVPLPPYVERVSALKVLDAFLHEPSQATLQPVLRFYVFGVWVLHVQSAFRFKI
jgi:hypothetical protein